MSDPTTKNQTEPDATLGTVYLVGAGPGDPELITVKGARLLAEADVVVFDRLVSPEILELIHKEAKQIYAGKGRNMHSIAQDKINETLAELAETHRTIVRLKGGDPFTFGRGGEEALYLAARDIPVVVVPGITSAAAAGAGLGLPLTHRGLATSVRYITGTCRKGEELDLNWQSLADPDSTLIVYMGLANIERIADELIGAGLPPETPAAAVQDATTKNERAHFATLASLAEGVRALDFKPPTLFIIGRVVDVSEELSRIADQSR